MPSISIFEFIPISLFSFQSEVPLSSYPDVDFHINKIMAATKMWFSKGESIAVWLLVATLSDSDTQHDNQMNDCQTNPVGWWRLARLVKIWAAAIGASASHGIIGTHDGLVYMWELSTGTKLGSLHYFKELGPYVNGKELVDVSGVVQSVSPTMSIRRKSNNEIVPKRDITIADKTKKSVVVSLWNDHATNVGYHDYHGKVASMASIGSDISPSSKGGVRSMYYDRVSLSHVTSNPSLAYISFIKPEQTMWYQACKTCNKEVTDAIESGYIMVVKVSDDSGEACLALFNEQAERIFGCSADELDKLKSQENRFQQKLKEAIWVPHLFRISVAQHEYMNEKRQWITARAVVTVDFAAESRLLLEEISKMKTSQ
ncbi:hypothetical protein AAG906_023417 [Vitis piasezkii]